MATRPTSTSKIKKVHLHRQSRRLELIVDEVSYQLSAEYLRVHSPSAEVRGHGPDQGKNNESKATGDLSQDVQLTIDKDLQFIAEKALKEAVVEYNAKKGGIGVIDVRTGEILAVANYPTFDPNKLKGSRPKDRKLSFVTDPFEPGSPCP